jgi:hypothetical protein
MGTCGGTFLAVSGGIPVATAAVTGKRTWRGPRMVTLGLTCGAILRVTLGLTPGGTGRRTQTGICGKTCAAILSVTWASACGRATSDEEAWPGHIADGRGLTPEPESPVGASRRASAASEPNRVMSGPRGVSG